MFSELFIFSLSLFIFSCNGGKESPNDKNRIPLVEYSRVTAKMLDESSGIIKSRQHDNTYWIHNDSGDEARIFAINKNGELLFPEGSDNYRGLYITGATNVDWEDIANDDQGNLYISDMGNNANKRKDMAIYIVKEPDPLTVTSVPAVSRIPVYYPDQTEFPPKKDNFDTEAMFWTGGKIYVMTKHRADTYTRLYRLDSLKTDKPNGLTYLGTFDTGEKVTAADVSPDGKSIAVLTYKNVWLFTQTKTSKYWLDGEAKMLPIAAIQDEGICFDGADVLVITNEQRSIYRVPVKDLRPVD
ncbi:MAG: hypothetical protein J0L62_12365 [Bacteroidetes bacterium]|nr:hypothetical protein [Bacteroidota bacterium]